MFDSIFDIMIVLIPLAIFIGRVVLQARNRHNPQPAKKQPPIPVHFEDYDDEDDRQFSPSAGLKTIIKKDRADIYNIYSPPSSMDNAPKLPPMKKAKAPSAEPAQGFLNLNHLSSMKQAVVLAEILGPPKGIE